MTTLQDQLRQAVAGSGKTICAVARGAGIADQVLRRFVNGERDLTLSTANRLVDYFDMRLTAPRRNQGGVKGGGR